MKGVLLINMGAPENPSELKTFLRRMFNDRHIIAAPWFVRKFLSFYISCTRYKKSWARYAWAGGSPLKRDTVLLAQELQAKLDGGRFSVKTAFSYTQPLIEDAVKEFIKENIFEIIAIPLYPQRSISTTGSVLHDIEKILNHDNRLKITSVKEFYDNEYFILFWVSSITKLINENSLSNPALVFSAHSLPLTYILKGDAYQKQVEKSAELIAGALKLKYRVSYQSAMNPETWLGPETSLIIKKQIDSGIKEIIVVPISFIVENIETRYDLDSLILPLFNNENYKPVYRVNIQPGDNILVSMLINLIEPYGNKN